MSYPSVDSTDKALRPIASLLGKSEKAREKLTPGTWQHAMLTRNITALRMVSLLVNEGVTVPENELRDAVSAIADMTSRSEKALSKFERGTSQHTLQRNRLDALRVAESLLRQLINQAPT